MKNDENELLEKVISSIPDNRLVSILKRLTTNTDNAVKENNFNETVQSNSSNSNSEESEPDVNKDSATQCSPTGNEQLSFVTGANTNISQVPNHSDKNDSDRKEVKFLKQIFNGGNSFKALRTLTGLTQEKLAQALGKKGRGSIPYRENYQAFKLSDISEQEQKTFAEKFKIPNSFFAKDPQPLKMIIDYSKLNFNFTNQELETLNKLSDKITEDEMNSLSECLKIDVKNLKPWLNSSPKPPADVNVSSTNTKTTQSNNERATLTKNTVALANDSTQELEIFVSNYLECLKLSNEYICPINHFRKLKTENVKISEGDFAKCVVALEKYHVDNTAIPKNTLKQLERISNGLKIPLSALLKKHPLKVCFDYQGLSDEDVAKLINKSVVTVNRVYKGERNLTPEEFGILSDNIPVILKQYLNDHKPIVISHHSIELATLYCNDLFSKGDHSFIAIKNIKKWKKQEKVANLFGNKSSSFITNRTNGERTCITKKQLASFRKNCNIPESIITTKHPLIIISDIYKIPLRDIAFHSRISEQRLTEVTNKSAKMENEELNSLSKFLKIDLEQLEQWINSPKKHPYPLKIEE